MGRRGPAPKPQAVKKLQGTHRADRDGGADAAVDDRKPQCPRWLGTAAKREWARISKPLHDAGLLTYVDRVALAMYCDAYGRWVETVLSLKGEPAVLQTDKGYMYPHPLVKLEQQYKTDVLRMAREFGMTPSARARVVVGDGGQAQEVSLADLLFEAIGE